MYWWSSSCISQQFVDGEAVWSEKVKTLTEKSKGRESVCPFSLPRVLQECWGGKATKCDPDGGQPVSSLWAQHLSELSLRSVSVKHSSKTDIN